MNRLASPLGSMPLRRARSRKKSKPERNHRASPKTSLFPYLIPIIEYATSLVSKSDNLWSDRDPEALERAKDDLKIVAEMLHKGRCDQSSLLQTYSLQTLSLIIKLTIQQANVALIPFECFGELVVAFRSSKSAAVVDAFKLVLDKYDFDGFGTLRESSSSDLFGDDGNSTKGIAELKALVRMFAAQGTDAKKLAYSFGPTVLLPNKLDNMDDVCRYSKRSVLILELLIENCEALFPKPLLVESTSSPAETEVSAILSEIGVVPHARAEFDFVPESPQELALKEGDVVKVLEKGTDGWWKGESLDTREIGLFPGEYVVELRQSMAPKPKLVNGENSRPNSLHSSFGSQRRRSSKIGLTQLASSSSRRASKDVLSVRLQRAELDEAKNALAWAQDENATLRAENAELRARIEALEKNSTKSTPLPLDSPPKTSRNPRRVELLEMTPIKAIPRDVVPENGPSEITTPSLPPRPSSHELRAFHADDDVDDDVEESPITEDLIVEEEVELDEVVEESEFDSQDVEEKQDSEIEKKIRLMRKVGLPEDVIRHAIASQAIPTGDADTGESPLKKQIGSASNALSSPVQTRNSNANEKSETPKLTSNATSTMCLTPTHTQVVKSSPFAGVQLKSVSLRSTPSASTNSPQKSSAMTSDLAAALARRQTKLQE